MREPCLGHAAVFDPLFIHMDTGGTSATAKIEKRREFRPGSGRETGNFFLLSGKSICFYASKHDIMKGRIGPGRRFSQGIMFFSRQGPHRMIMKGAGYETL